LVEAMTKEEEVNRALEVTEIVVGVAEIAVEVAGLVLVLEVVMAVVLVQYPEVVAVLVKKERADVLEAWMAI
jgi:hypothetical protein